MSKAKTKTEITRDVARLKKEIEALTGRVPVSSDPRYLAQRLSDLEKRKEAGEDVTHRDGEPQSVMSISMTVTARDAVESIIDREKIGKSELARRAFALWAEQNGYRKEAAAIGGD